MTNCSRGNDSPILAPKQQNVTIFGKTDFLGLKYPHHDHHDRGDHDDHGDHDEVGSYMRKLEDVHKEVGGCLKS